METEKRHEIDRLLAIMARLRDGQDGCPWDREQTFGTIAPYTIEEAYEVADAIDRGDMAALSSELGDLLFQVVFHAQMAKEARHFEFADVVRAVVDKMVDRHPHVFGDARVRSVSEQTRSWEQQKAEERRRKGEGDSMLDGVARTLPAVQRALKIQRRAAQVGFDWTDRTAAMEKLREEVDELDRELIAGADEGRISEELGDLMFTCVNVARHTAIDPETALRQANEKFERRFRRVEALAAEAGVSLAECDPSELDSFWRRVKSELG